MQLHEIAVTNVWDKQKQREISDYIDRRTWQASTVILSVVVL